MREEDIFWGFVNGLDPVRQAQILNMTRENDNQKPIPSRNPARFLTKEEFGNYLLLLELRTAKERISQGK